MQNELTAPLKTAMAPIIAGLRSINNTIAVVQDENEKLRHKPGFFFFKKSGAVKAAHIDQAIKRALSHTADILKMNPKEIVYIAK